MVVMYAQSALAKERERVTHQLSVPSSCTKYGKRLVCVTGACCTKTDSSSAHRLVCFVDEGAAVGQEQSCKALRAVYFSSRFPLMTTTCIGSDHGIDAG